MKKLIFLCSIILLLTACKTVRNLAKNNITADTEIKNDIVQKTDITAQGVTASIVTDQSTVTEKVDEVITTTLFSVPDSATGVQYPIQITTITRAINKGNNKNISSDNRETKDVSYVTKTVDQSDYKSEMKQKTEDKTVTEVKTPAWISLGVLVLIIALSILSYLVLKRYKLIK